jgi:hypothetical protein
MKDDMPSMLVCEWTPALLNEAKQGLQRFWIQTTIVVNLHHQFSKAITCVVESLSIAALLVACLLRTGKESRARLENRAKVDGLPSWIRPKQSSRLQRRGPVVFLSLWWSLDTMAGWITGQ